MSLVRTWLELCREYLLRNVFLFLCVFIVLVLSIIGLCEWSRPRLDQSLRSGDPCRAPCWQGLIPGEAAEPDVAGVLAKSPYVNQDTLRIGQLSLSGVVLKEYQWKDRGRGIRTRYHGATNAIYLLEGQVLLISLWPDVDFTLADVISLAGAPEGVYIASCVTKPCYTIFLDYPSQGMTFTSGQAVRDWRETIPEPGKAPVAPDMRVTETHYYEPTDYEKALLNVFLIAPDRVSLVMEGTHEWQGFVPMPMSSVYR